MAGLAVSAGSGRAGSATGSVGSAAGAVPDVAAPGLIVAEVRVRGNLAIAALRRQPGLGVVFQPARRGQIFGRRDHDLVRQLEVLQQPLLVREALASARSVPAFNCAATPE